MKIPLIPLVYVCTSAIYFVHIAVDVAASGLILLFPFWPALSFALWEALEVGKHLKRLLVFWACAFLDNFVDCSTRITNLKKKKSAGTPNSSEHEISAHAMHTVSDYRSSRPVSTPWAPTGTADAPSPRGDSDLLTPSSILFQFRHLSADFTASAHESWFADASSCHVTLQWHGS